MAQRLVVVVVAVTWTLGLIIAGHLRQVAGQLPVSYTYPHRLLVPRGGQPPQAGILHLDRTLRGRGIPGLPRNSPCCGRVNSPYRIIGGSPTSPQEFPWMAALVNTGTNVPFCGGSLVNDRYVITVGSCVETANPADVEVILGKHELEQDSGYDMRVSVAEIIVHPSYSILSARNDYAIVKLSSVLTLPVGNNKIAPICLPYNILYLPGQKVETAGWGLTQNRTLSAKLHSVTLKLESKLVCAKLMGLVTLDKTMICATGNLILGGRDACYGDLGGPLMAKAPLRRRRRMLLGLTSWGSGCAEPFTSGVYAKVPVMLDWLLVNMPDAQYC